MKKITGYVLAAAILIGLLIFIITSLWIGSDVRRYCRSAVKQYGGDCVTALSEQLNDTGVPYTDRNHAIWALGQMGDPRGLTYITKYYTGIIGKNENPEKGLSQYEMAKAIKLMQGGLNLPAIVWRHGIK